MKQTTTNNDGKCSSCDIMIPPLTGSCSLAVICSPDAWAEPLKASSHNKRAPDRTNSPSV